MLDLSLKKLPVFSQVRRFIVAYSGGLDSHVLLHAVFAKCQEHDGLEVVAVHVNHGLSKHASAWSAHCADQCEKLGVSFTVFSVDALPAPGESPEAAARTVRYRAFAGFVKQGDCLLTAHHQDDQAETLRIIRMIRLKRC